MYEVLIWVFGTFCGWLFSKGMDLIVARFQQKHSIKKNRKKEMSFSENHYKDILFLEQSIPYFAPENIHIHYNPSKCFFISFPSELIEQFDQLSADEKKPYMRKDTTFCELHIPNYSSDEIHKALQDSRIKIAQKFVNREGGMYFNNFMFGVINADSYSRTPDSQEKKIFNISFFETDYFTHRVVGDALESLQVSPDLFTREQLNGDLAWIRTSFGLSIILRIPASNEILLTVRSKNASYTDGKDLFYVSVTEAFSHSDYDHNGNPNLTKCLLRGLEEELGINEYMIDIGSIHFLDSFFETHFHQDGLVATVDLKENFTFADLRNLLAKDKQLEIAKMVPFPDSKSAIRKFIDENTNGDSYKLQAQTIFALESYLSKQ